MGDGPLLLLVLWLVYLADCVVWVDRHTWLFASWWSRCWRVGAANFLAGTRAGGLSPLNPLPPLGAYCLAREVPMCLSPDWLFAGSGRSVPGTVGSQAGGPLVAVDAIGTAKWRDGQLLINGRRFCSCADDSLGGELARVLSELPSLPRDQREARLAGFWERRLDVVRAATEWKQALESMMVLRALGNGMFLLTMVFIPLAAYSWGLLHVFIPSVAAMFLFAWIVAVEFFLTHRALFPRAEGDRWTHVLKIALFPPVAIRAADAIFAHLLTGFDAMALAALFLESSARDSFWKHSFRDLLHPVGIGNWDKRARQALQYQNRLILSVTCARLPGAHGVLQRAQVKPMPEGDDRTAYCPRCGVQFSITHTCCPDCRDVRLVAFTEEQASRQSIGS